MFLNILFESRPGIIFDSQGTMLTKKAYLESIKQYCETMPKSPNT